jgi:hypothetical protein
VEAAGGVEVEDHLVVVDDLRARDLLADVDRSARTQVFLRVSEGILDVILGADADLELADLLIR